MNQSVEVVEEQGILTLPKKEENVDDVTAEELDIIPEEGDQSSVDAEFEPGGEVDTVLEKAISMGYNPNHQGANKKTAEEFVAAGESHNGMLRERYNQLLEERKEADKALEYADNINKLLAEQLEDLIEAEKEKLAEAEEYENIADYKKHSEKLQKLESRKSLMVESPKQTNIDAMQAELRQWQAGSTWYEKEGFGELTMDATRYAEDQWRSRPPQDVTQVRAMIDDIERFARRMAPEKFYGKQTKKAAAPVANKSTPAAANKTITASASDLPADAKASLAYWEKRWKRMGLSTEKQKTHRANYIKQVKLAMDK